MRLGTIRSLLSIPFRAITDFSVRFWNASGVVRKIILGLFTLVMGINAVCELWGRIFGQDQQRSPASSLVKAGSGSVPGYSSPALELSTVTNNVRTSKTAPHPDFQFVTERMQAAYRVGDYTNAVKFAKLTEDLLVGVPENEFVHERLSILSLQAEDAFCKGEYKVAQERIRAMYKIKGVAVAETPHYRAFLDVAQLLEKGGAMLFFSPAQLGELRSWDPVFLEEYLAFLAAWGYIQPITLDPVGKTHRTFYYENYFGFKKPLPYQPCYRITTTNADGHAIASNEMSARWCGRGRFEPVDIDANVEKVMKLGAAEKRQRGIRLDLDVSKISGGACSLRWSIDPLFRISTNSVCNIARRPAWNPSIRVVDVYDKAVLLSPIRVQTVLKPYIPRWMIVLTLTLFVLLFSSVPPIDSKKVLRKKEFGEDSFLGIIYACMAMSSIGVVVFTAPGSQHSEILYGVGTGGLVTGIAGLIIEVSRKRQAKIQGMRTKLVYFKPLRVELHRTLGRILWYADRIDDVQFNWANQPQAYWTRTAWGLLIQHPEYKISQSAVVKRCEDIKAKYAGAAFDALPDAKKAVITQMHKILYVGCADLAKQILAVKQDRLSLSTQGAMSIDDVDALVFNVTFAMEIMSTKNGLSLSAIIDAISRSLAFVEDDSADPDDQTVGLWI